ncbi:MAG: FmdB family zinc ribbon protein [Planctomycetaceae bacterium]
MPMFEFECPRCDHTFEELLRVSQQAVCPTCGSSEVRKLLSAPAVRTRGAASLPVLGSACPPPSAHSCGPGCCRHH